MTESTAVHQLAFLTPDRIVAWKCLSLQAFENLSLLQFSPVAYASRSARFFPEFINCGPLHTDSHTAEAVLWVITCPIFRLANTEDRIFPPTLAARLVIREVLTGDFVMAWGQSADRSLEVPAGDGKAFQDWRRAVSVRGNQRRATFRITRDFARLTWKKMGKHNARFSQLEAWRSVRTAIADPTHSEFLAHTDATECLSNAFAKPGLAKQAPAVKKNTVAWQLMSPRRLPANCEAAVACLEKLAEAGRAGTIFLNYRWNTKAKVVAEIALELLGQDRGIWLDRLQTPGLQSHPVWRSRGAKRRKDPPGKELKDLLHNAIQRSSLFLSLACEDYEQPPRDRPKGKNWAQKERQYAGKYFQKQATPRLGLVDLGGAPATLHATSEPVWSYGGNPSALSRDIAASTRRWKGEIP